MSRLRMIAGGLKSLLPLRGHYSMAERPVDVLYGYGVWLRHLTGLAAAGVNGPFRRIAEIGPGNSAAIAACALKCGATSYIGLDVLPHLAIGRLATTFDEINALFAAATPIPSGGRFSTVYPEAADSAFPCAALEAFRGEGNLQPDAAGLRADLMDLESGGSGGEVVRWICPWSAESLPADSVDLVISQAVLQEIPVEGGKGGLLDVMQAMARFLKRHGVASHQIDLGFYGNGVWNEHWSWSDFEWRLIRGRRENFVNREPLSTYLTLAERAGFEVVKVAVVHHPGVDVDALAPRYRALPEGERTARAAHLILRKR